MVQKLFFFKLEPDLDPYSEKLCEHGAWCYMFYSAPYILHVVSFDFCFKVNLLVKANYKIIY